VAKLSETIKEITRDHLENHNGLLLGQCLTAVGWINNTVPNCKNLIELPLCDMAGAGFAVGAAISGRRPILVIRYQDFILSGVSSLVNYAAKSKDILGKGCPIFIRLIADEGKGLGTVHTAKLHSIFTHFPGFRVCAPISSSDYKECWNTFMLNDDPMIVSEHRSAYQNELEYTDIGFGRADVVLFAISIARFNALKAREILLKDGIKCNLVNILWLKPFYPELVNVLLSSKMGIVIDTGFQNCGTSESIAYKLMINSGKKVYALGLKDYSAGCTKETENLTPSVKDIVDYARSIVSKSR
jgi:pyruvate/2-oxoglutarate/acetoin dehydrogenase E1 component